MAAPTRRRMTPAEWREIAPAGTEFPNLNPFAPDSEVWVTGEPDPLYNCFAWTLGREDRWLIPGTSIEKVDSYYVDDVGWARSSKEKADIDVWMADVNVIDDPDIKQVVRHFSRFNGTLWESKMGKGVRIVHPREALTGPSYGSIQRFYRTKGPAPGALFETPEQSPPLNKLAQSLTELFPALSHAFDSDYGGWRSLWPAIIPKADEFPPEGVLKHDAWGQMTVALGARTLPLVAQKMQYPDQGPAVYVYEQVMADIDEIAFCVDKTDVTNYIDWLNRMWKSVILYSELYNSFQQRVKITRDTGLGGLYANIEEAIYTGKVATTGQLTLSILPFIIVEYETHPSEPWDAILQRIVKGAYYSVKNRENYYKPWATWFGNVSSNRDNAP
ncbi:hypothetical protein BDP27DRAFT_1367760 [Rhodocollybia butyracea]|uniref:DUF7689 domain-containing protein n=1 Tax=Rhodocollybia butyracea TaxID=206335 RepID=A0A9P5PH24_9AGAR|nr:hypothetical protein BDP27DRAFT_1367760 [Rhodocollybia butyracea]